MNRTDYGKYLFGTDRKRLEELAIFEIGGLGTWDGKGAPIIDSLPQRKAKRVIYRGIDNRACPYIFGISPVNPEEYRPRSKRMLKEHVGNKEGIDSLTIRWSGWDVPYPFSNGSFDEFHSHMVTSSLIGPEQNGYKPTPEGFADEVDRLLKPRGRVYLSTDLGHFFPHSWEPGSNQRVELADKLIQRFRTQGYSINELDASRDFQEELQGRDYGVPIKKASFGPIMPFTYIYSNIEFVLIATKASHPIKKQRC